MACKYNDAAVTVIAHLRFSAGSNAAGSLKTFC